MMNFWRYWIVFALLSAANAADEKASSGSLKRSLTFHAGFDGSVDAGFGAGDRRLYTAPSYKALVEAKPGLDHPDVEMVKGGGRFGDALRFRKKNTRAVHYRAAKNVAFDPRNWTGAISFWLRLDPDKELEPGFCDPVQVTDKDYNNSAIWVDFTKDETPRHFRLGVFGDLKSWNPEDIPPDKNPAFLSRLVVVSRPPFTADRWVHVVVTHSRLGSGGGSASLYLDGKLQGTARNIREPFGWDLTRGTIRVGVNYVGLFDDLALFNRALSEQEVVLLNGLKRGVSELYE